MSQSASDEPVAPAADTDATPVVEPVDTDTEPVDTDATAVAEPVETETEPGTDDSPLSSDDDTSVMKPVTPEPKAETEPAAETEPEPEPDTWIRVPLDELSDREDEVIDAVERGDCIVLPTDTVYGIGVDAFNADAVAKLLAAKERGRDKPPPVLIADAGQLKALTRNVPGAARNLMEKFWPGALTLILKAHTTLRMDLGDTDGTIGLRVPDHEATREILRTTGPLAVSSANKTGRPAAITADDAIAQLGNAVAVYLDGGALAEGETAAPSTMIDFTRKTDGVVVRLGALSLAELQEVAPHLTELESAPESEAEPAPDPGPAPAAADADPTGSADADTSDTDSSETDPSETDPSETDPSETDPSETDSADTDFVDSESADDGSAETGSGDVEPVAEGGDPDPMAEPAAEDTEPEERSFSRDDIAARIQAVGGDTEVAEPSGMQTTDPEPTDPDPTETSR